jgi:hypothetical protein
MFYATTKFITLFTREALQWKQHFYGYVSLHMFKITLIKRVGKIQYITTYSVSHG